MLGGDTLFYVFISIIVSCFTCATLAIDLYYEVIHDTCLLFFVMCFVTDYQRGSLLGSKTLGSKCIRISMYNVGKP